MATAHATTSTERDTITRLSTRLDQLTALLDTIAAKNMDSETQDQLAFLARDLAGDARRDAHELEQAPR
jgi:hypothetical protein